jgi:hypothetical protein
MSETTGPQKQNAKEKYPDKLRVALTFGNVWSDLLDKSLARQFAKIAHLPLGNPKFKLDRDLYSRLCEEAGEDPLHVNTSERLHRINSNSKQSSEIIFKLSWYIKNSTHIFIDASMLDTAIGHHILIQAKLHQRPTWAVAVDERSSPLAAAYLKGIIFPTTPDDILSIILQNP